MAKRGVKTSIIQVEVPTKLLQKLEPILVERGLTLDEVVRLYIRSLVSTAAATRALEPENTMYIGKYKHEKVGVVIRAEPLYITWLLGVSTTFKLGPRALELLETCMKEETE